MDERCNNSKLSDSNKTFCSLKDSAVNTKMTVRCESPVFRIDIPHKSNPDYTDSSDYDIPSYQINQSDRKRTCGSETSDSILPLSPVFTPFGGSQRFQPHSVRSLDTVAKRFNLEKSSSSSMNSKSLCKASKETRKMCGVFESLGMIDKDISWASSMASPDPAQVPGSQFNTVEKATFFPEEKFQNIQPRALFSPTLDDDFGCKPLAFSSDSEDENSYKTNMRLSDVCATLKQLEFKSLSPNLPDTCDNNLDNVQSRKSFISCSPVIKTKRKKKSETRKKKKGTLVKSPDLTENHELSQPLILELGPGVTDCEDVEIVKRDSVKTANKNLLVKSPNLIGQYEFCVPLNLDTKFEAEFKSSENEDTIMNDSFQGMSFSGIDELCKTIVNTTGQSDCTSQILDCDKQVNNESMSDLLTEPDSIQKFLYDSKANSEVLLVTSNNKFLSDALSIEESLKVYKNQKIDKSLADKGIVRLDSLENKSIIDATKRLHSELSEKKSDVREKKIKTEDTSNWDMVSNYLSESQLNVSDSEMFRTVEKLEKTLVSQEAKKSENKVDNLCSDVEMKDLFLCSLEKKTFLSDSFVLDDQKSGSSSHEVETSKSQDTAVRRELVYSVPTISRETVSVPVTIKEFSPKRDENDYKNSDSRSVDVFNNRKPDEVTLMSSEVLKSIKEDIREGTEEVTKSKEEVNELGSSLAGCEVVSEFEKTEQNPKEVLGSFIGFKTASGLSISVSDKALEKGKKLMVECSENPYTVEKVDFGSDLYLKTPEKNLDKENITPKCHENSLITVPPECETETDKSVLLKSKNSIEIVPKSEEVTVTLNGLKTTVSRIKIPEKAIKPVKNLDCDESIIEGLSSKSHSKLQSKEVLERQFIHTDKCKSDSLKSVLNSEVLGQNLTLNSSSIKSSGKSFSQKSTSDSINKTGMEDVGVPVEACRLLVNEDLKQARVLMDACDRETLGSGRELITIPQPEENFNEPTKLSPLVLSNVLEIEQSREKHVETSEEPPSTSEEKTEIFQEKQLEGNCMTKKTGCDLLKFSGFKTASGVEVTVSEKALKKGKQLLEQCDKDVLNNSNKTPEMSDKENEIEPLQKVSTSQERDILGDLSNELKNTSRTTLRNKQLANCSINEVDKVLGKHDSVGFTSWEDVSGSLKEVPNISKPKDPETSVVSLNTSKDITGNDFVGFVTASGAKVSVSEKALMKGRQFLLDCDKEVLTNQEKSEKLLENSKESFQTLDIFCGDEFEEFKTATGGKVVVSDENKRKELEILADCSKDVSGALTKVNGASDTKFMKKPEVSFKSSGDMTGHLCVDLKTPLDLKAKILDESLKNEQSLKEVSNFSEPKNPETSVVSLNTPKDITGNHFVGFVTASGSKVTISEESLKKGRQILAECEKDIPGNLQVISEYSEPKDLNESAIIGQEKASVKGSFSVGFKTAAGLEVPISKEALEKGRQFLKKCDEVGFNDSKNVSSNGYIGFKTPPNSNASISEENLEKERKMLEEREKNVGGSLKKVSNSSELKDPETPKVSLNNSKGITGNHFVGFVTALGSKVTISEESLKKGRQILAECEKDISGNLGETSEYSEQKDLKKPNVSCNNSKNISSNGYMGLKTSASNVSISEENLEKERKILGKREKGICESLNEVSNSSELKDPETSSVSLNNSKDITGNHFVGFVTALGSKVTISEESLKKGRQILAECEKDIPGNLQESSEYSEPKDLETSKVSLNTSRDLTGNHFVGFVTASGSKVSISEESLKKGRQILAECEKDVTVSLKEVANCSEPKDLETSKVSLNTSKDITGNHFVGFVTASGSKVSISEESLKKGRQILAECDECLVTDQAKNANVCSNKTSKKPSQNLLKEVLVKRKGLLKIPTESSKKGIISVGFKTAGGLEVSISKEALEKGRQFLKQCDEDTSVILSESTRSKSMEDRTILSEKVEDHSISLPEVIKKPEGDRKSCGNTTELTDDCQSDWKDSSNCSKSSRMSESNDDLDKTFNRTWIDVRSESYDMSGVSFSTASGIKLNVSEKSLAKARELMANCSDNSEVCESSVSTIDYGIDLTISGRKNSIKNSITKAKVSFRETVEDTTFEDTKEPPEGSSVSISKDLTSFGKLSTTDQSSFSFMSFTNTSHSKEVSEITPLKPKECCDQENSRETMTTHESFSTVGDSAVMKERTEVFDEKSLGKVEESIPEITVENDWEEIIPNWLHVYNTSPSMASEKFDLSPVKSNVDGRSRSESEFVIKSPVLGLKDRFYKKIKRRKLQFENSGTEEQKDKKTGCQVTKKEEGKTSGRTKRLCSNLSLDFSAPFKKAKCMDTNLQEAKEVHEDVKNGRVNARLDQAKLIKDKGKVKPLKGSYLVRKSTEKLKKWKDAVQGGYPEVHSEEALIDLGVKPEVLTVCVENAVEFKFKAEDFYGSGCASNTNGIPIGDGCLVIPDDKNTFGVEEMKRGFLASPGIQPSLVPEGWLENHYKWIVWKLAHYERSFPRIFGGTSLTPNNVLLQMKYRYDREIDRNERSALKKILERDDTSIRRMVVCVCGIKKVTGETSGYEFSVTDGWYSCPARTDPAMTRLVETGKIFIGMKLVTQGAVLVNCEQGVAPLEITSDVHLKISTNSTRRVRWDTKLGFQKNPENILISLSSILPQGGQISRIDFIVVRVYPVLFMEKTLDGHRVTRNRRSEEKAEAEFRKAQEQKLEKIYNEVSLEVQKSLNRNSENSQEEDFGNFLSSEPLGVQERLSASTKYFSRENDCFSRKLSEKIEQRLSKEKLNKRDVSQFFRVKIVDFRKPDYNNPAVLSIWNPDEEVIGLLAEGNVISATNVAISQSSRTFKLLQINSTRQTLFRKINQTVKYPSRRLTRLKEVSSKSCPLFQEIDVVGVVVHIQEASYGSRTSQTVYLTDLDFHFVGIVFWGSCKDYCWENVLKVSSVVACNNLQWDKSCSFQEVPSLHVNENTVFTENPKLSHLKEEMERLATKMPKDLKSFLTKCQEELTVKLEESRWKANNSSRNNSRGNDSSSRDSSRSGFPSASSTPLKALPPGIAMNEPEPSPIQKKIEKLESYGEPPPLIPLIVSNRVRKLRRKC